MLTSYISTMIADPKGMLKGLVIIQHVILKGSNGTNEGLAVINVEKPGIVDVGINYIAILLNGFCRVNRKGFEDHRVLSPGYTYYVLVCMRRILFKFINKLFFA